MTLDAYFTRWLDDTRGTVRYSTWVSYEGHYRLHISPLLGGMIVGRIRPDDVRRLIRRLVETKSAATARKVITTLRIGLNRLVRERALQDNPAAHVALPREDHEPVRALSPEDAARVMEAISGDPLESLYVLLLGSGLRLGEAVALTWRDVDLDAGFVSIRVSKTRIRATPINEEAAEALRQHRSKTPRYGLDEPVFLGPRTKERLRASTVSHAFPRLLEKASLPRMTVHQLRHGHATLLLAQGVPMRVIAEQLGHADPGFTSRLYAHVVPAVQNAAVKGLRLRGNG
jgi:integrase